jgi:hypothetical protein
MPAAPTCSWLPDAAADLRALVATSCPALARRLGPAVDRISRMNGGNDAPDSLMRSGSTPFVRLIDAFAADLGLADDPRTALIGRSTVLAYLYVRLQDDLVDEEALVDRASVFAMEVALSAHVELLARAEVPVKVWIARSRLMARFAAFAATECDERGHDDGAAAERTGEKFLGMAMPLVALAALAGRDDLEHAATELVVDLGTTLQMLNDILNAPEDHAAKRTTPLLRWLAASGVTTVTRAALIGHPVTRRALDIARTAATRATSHAGALGLTHTAELIAETRALVERTSERLLAQILGLCA